MSNLQNITSGQLQKMSLQVLQKMCQDNNIIINNIKQTKSLIIKEITRYKKIINNNKIITIQQNDIDRIEQIKSLYELSKEPIDILLGYCQYKKWNINKRNKKTLIDLIKTHNNVNYHQNVKQYNLDREKMVREIIEKSKEFNPISEIMLKLNCQEHEAKKLYDLEIGQSIQRIQKEIYRKISLDIDPQIKKEIQSEMIICFNCGKKNYGKSSVEKWLDNIYCLECHYKLFSNEIQNRWNLFQQWKISEKLDKCFIMCGSIGQHFDHKNIFDKCQDFDSQTNSLPNMIRRGYPMELIYKEIKEKTIPLCVSCHNIITKLENKYFLTRLKTKITNECKKDELDDKSRQNQILSHKDEFSDLCNSFYNFVQQTISNI